MNQEITVAKNVETEIENRTNSLLALVNGLEIKNVADRDLMMEYVGTAKKGIKFVKDNLAELNESTKSARREYLKLESRLISPFEEGRYIGDQKLKKWLRDAEEKRIADQKAIDDKAEADRKREEERVAKLHAKAEAKGKVSTAKERFIPQVTIKEPEAPKGSSFTDNWSAVVTDPMAVLKQVIAGKLPMSAVDFNMPTLNKLARAHMVKNVYPGIEFVNNQTINHHKK